MYELGSGVDGLLLVVREDRGCSEIVYEYVGSGTIVHFDGIGMEAGDNNRHAVIFAEDVYSFVAVVGRFV